MRQAPLGRALDRLLDHQRSLGLPTAEPAVERFYDRPFLGVPDAVAASLRDAIVDPRVRRLPAGVGSVEQWVDNVDVLVDPARRLAVARAALGANEQVRAG